MSTHQLDIDELVLDAAKTSLADAPGLAEDQPPELTPPKPEDLTDLGNARLFVQLYGRDFRFVSEWRGWVAWSGLCWRRISAERIGAEVNRFVADELPQRAMLASDFEVRKKALGWALTSSSASRIAAVEQLARNELAIDVSQLDANPHIFTCRNVVIDTRTGEVVPARRTDYATKQADVDYNPNASCRRWLEFISETLVGRDGLPDAELIAYTQRAVGYSLTSDVGEHALFLATGPGANGKGVFQTVLASIAGDYACVGDESLFFERGLSSNDEGCADLLGKRLVFASESRDGRRFDEARIKRLTGGDRIRASRKYEHAFEFAPTFKLWLACNHLPRFDSDDLAMLRRLRVIPFYNTVAPEKRRPDLAQHLLDERSGIFNWCLAGMLLWRAGGRLHEASVPLVMREAVTAYVSENDPVGEFISEHIDVDPMTNATKASVYAAYRQWSETNGRRPFSSRAFSDKLVVRGYRDGRDKTARFWEGIRLRDCAG